MKNNAILHAPLIHKIKKNLTPDEEALIAAAEMPVKEPISDSLLWETRDAIRNNRKVLIQGVCITLAAMGVGLLLGAFKYSIALGLTAVVFGIAAIVLHRHSKIDETATMMRVPIHHTNNNLIGNYAVCYLPDGKYELRLSGDKEFANSLLIVQYRKMTSWQAVFHDENAENAAPPSTLDLPDNTEDADEPEDSCASAEQASDPETVDPDTSERT